MSVKKVATNQPDFFQFSEENLNKAKKIIKKYPEKKQASALMPLLYLVQKQNENWIPLVAMKYLAKMLAIPYIQVYEVATFYSMYNLSPVGKYFVQVCTSTPCMNRVAEKLVVICKYIISPAFCNKNLDITNLKIIWTAPSYYSFKSSH